MLKAFVLIQTVAGTGTKVRNEIGSVPGVRLAQSVTGPYDLIVRAEGADMDELGRVLSDIQMVPGIKNKLFGGEGLFYAKMTGPGVVWMQTLPFSRLADRIIAAAPGSGGSAKGEGSILGGLGRMLDGD